MKQSTLVRNNKEKLVFVWSAHFFFVPSRNENSGPAKIICAVATGEGLGRHVEEEVGEDYFPRGTDVFVSSGGVFSDRGEGRVKNQIFDHLVCDAGW